MICVGVASFRAQIGYVGVKFLLVRTQKHILRRMIAGVDRSVPLDSLITAAALHAHARLDVLLHADARTALAVRPGTRAMARHTLAVSFSLNK